MWQLSATNLYNTFLLEWHSLAVP